MKSVNFEYIRVVRPIWEVFDNSIVDFDDGFNQSEKTTIIGKKTGVVTISYGGIRREIIVEEKNNICVRIYGAKFYFCL